MRINSLAAIAHYAKEIDSNVIYMDQSTYINLDELTKRSRPASTLNRAFYEANFTFELLEKDNHVKVAFPLT